MDKRIADYIENNRVCSEWIFSDWNEFLELLFDCGGRVQAILWYEYVKINKQKKSLGGGGYRDTKNPDYMWAETTIFIDNLANSSLSELREYIQNTINKHHPHRLTPCFLDIRE